jgi:hypothetical protein
MKDELIFSSFSFLRKADDSRKFDRHLAEKWTNCKMAYAIFEKKLPSVFVDSVRFHRFAFFRTEQIERAASTNAETSRSARANGCPRGLAQEKARHPAPADDA